MILYNMIQVWYTLCLKLWVWWCHPCWIIVLISFKLKLGRSTALHSVSIFSLEMGPAMEISWHKLALLAQRAQGPIWNLVVGVGHKMVELLNRLCLISLGEYDRIIQNPYRHEPANLRIPPFLISANTCSNHVPTRKSYPLCFPPVWGTETQWQKSESNGCCENIIALVCVSINMKP